MVYINYTKWYYNNTDTKYILGIYNIFFVIVHILKLINAFMLYGFSWILNLTLIL